MPRPVDCYLGLGANLGDRRANLREGARRIALSVGRITGRSKLYESAPWGEFEGPTFPYLNGCLRVRTRLSADEVLERLLTIERHVGRERSVRNAPRTLDLDLLFYGQHHIHHPNLVVPHPDIAARRFVLRPLHDIDPDFIHPALGRSVRELLAACPDPLPVRRFA